VKKTFTAFVLLLAFTLISSSASAQGCPGCVVQDTLCTGIGWGEICTDSIATATEGAAYEQHVTFRFPTNYIVKGTDPIPGFPGGAFTWGMFLPANTFPYVSPIDTASVSSVNGLPMGLNWQTDSSANGNMYRPSSNPYGCLNICGNPDCSSAGPYTVEITLTMNVDMSGLFTQLGGGGFPFPIPSFSTPIDSTFPLPLEVLPSSLLVLDVTADTAVIDSGQSIDIDAAPGFSSYVWSTGDTTASITDTPTANTTYLVTATDSNGCAQQDSFAVQVLSIQDTTIIDTTDTSTTGIIDIQPKVVVYPNPGNGAFTLQLPAEIFGTKTDLVVYDIRGREVYRELIPANSADTKKKLFLQALGKGVYFLNLTSGKYNINSKLTIY
jgi:hypothetical protein